MVISNPKYVSELNEIAQLCTDLAESHERAVQTVTSSQLAGFCKRRAEEYRRMAKQFRLRIDELGETPDEGGSLRGAAEKVLSDVKGIVGDDEDAIISEVSRLEDQIVERFELFLDAGVPPEADSLIRKCHSTVADGYAELQRLSA